MSSIQHIPTPFSYSSAVVAGDTVFLGLHRGFGETFAEQFESAFAALNATLAKLGLTVENLVKINVWLKEINDLPEMEQRFHGHFAREHFPARMTA
ncbi:MAG: RidA family protein, partial [Caldilineaceae bacterium]|nr:RidA family protein [Caldilineaceae bacterium]